MRALITTNCWWLKQFDERISRRLSWLYCWLTLNTTECILCSMSDGTHAFEKLSSPFVGNSKPAINVDMFQNCRHNCLDIVSCRMARVWRLISIQYFAMVAEANNWTDLQQFTSKMWFNVRYFAVGSIPHITYNDIAIQINSFNYSLI